MDILFNTLVNKERLDKDGEPVMTLQQVTEWHNGERVPAQCLVGSLQWIIQNVFDLYIRRSKWYEWSDPKKLKKQLPIIQLFATPKNEFHEGTIATQENCTVEENWNGCVFVDLDWKNSKILQEDLHDETEWIAYYNKFVEAIKGIPNFLYSDLSVSKKGFHGLFYYDAPKTKENFFTFCNFTKYQIIQKCSKLMPEAVPVLAESEVYDPSTNSIWQKCIITTFEYFLNAECTGQVDLEFAREKAKEIAKEYPNRRPRQKKRNGAVSDENSNPYKIDNATRLKVATALKLVCRDEEEWTKWYKRICEEYVARNNEEHTSEDYFYQVNYKRLKVDVSDLSMLEVLDGIPPASKLLRRDEFMSSKRQVIIEELEQWHNIEVIAPTGTGKTYLINNDESDPFFIDEDCRSLAKALNAVVIVPFLTSNSLYGNCRIVTSENVHTYRAGEPCVMVFDCAVKIWDRIEHRTLIIDEAHQLYSSRSYREASIALHNLLRDKIKNDPNFRSIFFTATPTGEFKSLGINKELRFYNLRNHINTMIIKGKPIYASERKFICAFMQGKTKYDKLVVFDNKSVYGLEQMLKENQPEKGGEFAMLRASTQYEEDFQRVLTTEIIDKPLTLCTSIADVGLNFKNKGEKVAIITRFTEEETLYADIVQQTGRFRFCDDVTAYIYVTDKPSEAKGEKIERFDRINARFTNEDDVRVLFSAPDNLTDKQKTEVQKELMQYAKSESTSDNLWQKLRQYGYFDIHTSESEEDYLNDFSLNQKYKRQASKELRTEIKDDINIMMNKYEDVFKQGVQDTLRKLMNDFIKYLDYERIKQYLLARDERAMIDNCLADLERFAYISNMPEKRWKELKALWNDKLKNAKGADGMALMEQKNRIKENEKWRRYVNKYGKEGSLDHFIEDTRVQTEKAQEKRANGGKASKTNHAKVVIYNGREYQSAQVLAKMLGVSTNTITRWIKAGKCLVKGGIRAVNGDFK